MSNILYAYLFDEINYQNVKDVFIDLNNAKDDEEIQKVSITLCSPGGYYLPAFALYDAIKSFPKDIEIIATGNCQSSALLILQAAKKRVATKNTVFMLHSTHHKMDNSDYKTIIAEVEQFKVEYEKFVELSVIRSKIDKNKFEDMTNRQKYLTPEEALEMGLIDEII